MPSFSQKTFTLALITILFPLLLPAQNQSAQHPLDALKTQEYCAVYDVLRDSGKIDKDTVTHSVLLHDPAKDKLLAWTYSDPTFRDSAAILFSKAITID